MLPADRLKSAFLIALAELEDLVLESRDLAPDGPRTDAGDTASVETVVQVGGGIIFLVTAQLDYRPVTILGEEELAATELEASGEEEPPA